MITSKYLLNTHLLSTVGKHVVRYAKYENVINNIGKIKIKHQQTTRERGSLSIRMIREGLRGMITCGQGIGEEV